MPIPKLQTLPSPEIVALPPETSVGLRCPFTGAPQTVVCRKRPDGSRVYSLTGGFDPYVFSRDRESLETAICRRASGNPVTGLKCPYTNKAIHIARHTPSFGIPAGFLAVGDGFHPSEWVSSLEDLLRSARMRAGKPSNNPTQESEN